MGSLGKTSMLGRSPLPTTNPFSNFTVFPDDAAPMIQALAEQGAFPGMCRWSVPVPWAGWARWPGESASRLGQRW